MIILSQKFAHEGQDFEIFVKYDAETNQAVEIKNITLHTHCGWYPVGSIMTKFFKDRVWELIMGTDWEAIYKDLTNPAPKKKESLLDNIHPVMQGALKPFLVTGGELKTIFH